MPNRSFLEAIHAGLAGEMERDDSVMVMGEDVGLKGGVFRVTEGLQQRFGELRVMDTPLAESLIVGVAIGASLNGMRPVAEIQFADFMFPAFDQIVSEAARMRYRSNGDFDCPLVIRAPFGGGVHGALYHSQSVEAFYAHVPGLKVVIPSTPYDAKGLLVSAIRDPDPVMYFEHKRMYRLIRGEVPDDLYTLPIGPAEVRREGRMLSVLTWGMAVHQALEAAETVSGEGIDAEVVDLRSLRPLDRETILASARKTGRVLIVHEDNLTGGFGAEIAAVVADEAFEYLDAPVRRLAGPDIPAMPFNVAGEQFFLVNPEKIAEAMRQLAAY